MKPSAKNKNKVREYNWRVPGFLAGAELVPDALSLMEKQYSGAKEPSGLSLLPACLQPGGVSVICAGAAVGKSAFLLNLALEAVGKKLNTAVFLADSTVQEFAFKAICAKAEVNLGGAKHGRLPREAWPKLTRAAGELTGHGLYFCPSGIVSDWGLADQAQVLAEALKKNGKKLDLVIVDPLNFVKSDAAGPSPLEIINRAAENLETSFVCSFNMPFRPEKGAKADTLGDIRLAGLDDTLADYIYTLHRDELYHRCDPTVKGQARLFRLKPYLLPGKGADHCLKFNSETLRFSLPLHTFPDREAGGWEEAEL